MRLATVSLDHALGGILVHNIADEQGHKALSKGRRLDAADLGRLRAMGRDSVYVAQLEPGDVPEDEAAGRIALAVCGENVKTGKPTTGRVNVFAGVRGVFSPQAGPLLELNMVPGVTLATLPAHTVVAPPKMVATIKTVGLALPASALGEVEDIARRFGPPLQVRPMGSPRVAIVLTGSPQAQGRVEQTYREPIEGRVRDLGGQIVNVAFVPEEEGEIARALQQGMDSADMVILAGETSIMDRADITPRGILRAGGKVEVYGAPVEPGNLLLLAYRGATPIVGAPGCVKSREANVVDLILPRLFAGEHLTRNDIAELANGGLLI